MRITSPTKAFDQFFTKQEVSERLAEQSFRVLEEEGVDLATTLFIEPSAGYGCFVDSVRDAGYSIDAYDIDPKRQDVRKNDFLDDELRIEKSKKNVVIIGNPPFGYKGKKALQFILKSFEYADFVCFIVPNTFTKYSIQRLLSPEIKIIYQTELNPFSFYTNEKENVDIGCVFQILTTKNTLRRDIRTRVKPPITHNDFVLYQYNNTKQALKYFENDFDVAIFNQGWGEYPTIKYKNDVIDKKKQWLLVKAKNEIIMDRILHIDYKKLSNQNTTTKGFRKADFVSEYMRMYG